MNKFFAIWKKFGMFGLLVLIIAFFGIMDRTGVFLSSTTLWNVLKQASVTGVLACGICPIMLSGGMELSAASRMGLTTIIIGLLLMKGVSIPVAILIGLLFAMLTGTLTACIAEVLHTTLFVTTLAMNYVWTGICYLAVGPATIYGFDQRFKVISQTLIGGVVPSIILVFVVCALIAHFVLSKTYFGRCIYALGGNREAARLAGIPVVKINILTHTMAGLFLGIAAVILMSRTMIASAGTSGGTYSFDVLIACVLGGILLSGGEGKMYQAVLGILVINVLFNGMTIVRVSDYWQMVVKGAILFLAVGLDLLQKISAAKTKKAAEKAAAAVAKEAASE